jgi:hypothetical protein
MSRDKLMELARGRALESTDRSIDVQVSRLRKLLGEDPNGPRFIQTVWGSATCSFPTGARAVRVFPASLLWRTLLVLVAALVLSQAAAIWLFDEYVTAPRAALGLRQFVSHLKTVSAALETMEPVPARGLHRPHRRDGRHPHHARCAGHGGSARPDVPPMRVFRERLRDTFGPTPRYTCARNAPARGLRAPAARAPSSFASPRPAQYWVAIPRGRIDRDPGTAVFAWSLAGLGSRCWRRSSSSWRLNRPLAELARARPSGSAAAAIRRRSPRPARRDSRGRARLQPDEGGPAAAPSASAPPFLAGVSHDLRTRSARLRLGVEMLEARWTSRRSTAWSPTWTT